MQGAIAVLGSQKHFSGCNKYQSRRFRREQAVFSPQDNQVFLGFDEFFP